MSLESGNIPDDWRTSIVPIFKKGDKHQASNYRPVSLTSISCKLLEHIIHSQVMDHFDHHSILSNSQHGFRSRRSCETQLAITIDTIARTLDEGGQVDIVLLDFAKAFDKVPHQRLLHKLQFYGVRNNTLRWIEDFLHCRQQQVLLDGHTSSTAEVLSGVPQGTVLGPLLFLSFINDLPDVTKSESHLFADDCLLFCPVNSAEDSKRLQQDLAALERWEKEWQMAFHPEKCVVIQVASKCRTISADYVLHNHHLDVVDSSKYLGVTISNNLKWDRHIDNITAKANRTLGFLKQNLRGCRTSARARAYEAIVRPTLEYAASIWDPHTTRQVTQIEKVQRRAARFVTRNYWDRQPGSVTNMVTSLGWEPLQVRRVKIRLLPALQDQAEPGSDPSGLLSHPVRQQNERSAHLPNTKHQEGCVPVLLLPTYYPGLEPATIGSNISQFHGGVPGSTGQLTTSPVHWGVVEPDFKLLPFLMCIICPVGFLSWSACSWNIMLNYEYISVPEEEEEEECFIDFSCPFIALYHTDTQGKIVCLSFSSRFWGSNSAQGRRHAAAGQPC